MDFLKSHWRVCLLLVLCVALLIWTLFKPTPIDYSKSLYNLTLATLVAILAAHLAEAFETRKLFESLEQQLLLNSKNFETERLYHVVAACGPNTQIPSDREQEVWYELCVAMTHSYCATNYGDLRSMYDSPIARAALAIQKAKITAAGFTISKVFMADSVDEIARSREIRDQMTMGIVTKWIPRVNVDKDNALDSIDFAIFDDKVVLAWKLNEARQIMGARLYYNLKDQAKIDRYKKCFTALMAQSQAVCPSGIDHDTVLRRLTLQEAVEAVSAWPGFLKPFEELSYALDPINGWLKSYASHKGSHIFGLFEDQRLIGFSILDVNPMNQIEGSNVEFYVAIHRDYEQRGLGKVLTHYTVAEARRAKLSVFLRIRQNHPGATLYKGCGFDYVLDCDGNPVQFTDTVNGTDVTFFVMKLDEKQELRSV